MSTEYMHLKKKKKKVKLPLKERFVDFWIPIKGDSASKIVSKILSIFALLILIISITLIVGVIAKYIIGNKNVSDWNKLYSGTSSIPAVGEKAIPSPDMFDKETGVLSTLKNLYKINNELIGHVSIDNTKLALPVMKGKDNQYYLDHTLEKQSNPFGIPFVDNRATITQSVQSTNLVLYGHAAKDGSFFAGIKNYSDLDFYKKHPLIRFNTIYGNGLYKVVGAFTVDTTQQVNGFDYHNKINLTPDQLKDYLKEVDKRSYFNTNVDIKNDDRLITLSTCNGVNATPLRSCVVARKVRPGETTSVDISKATENTDMVMPDVWVAKNKKANQYQ